MAVGWYSVIISVYLFVTNSWDFLQIALNSQISSSSFWCKSKWKLNSVFAESLVNGLEKHFIKYFTTISFSRKRRKMPHSAFVEVCCWWSKIAFIQWFQCKSQSQCKSIKNKISNKLFYHKSQQHLVFPGGLPSKYYPGPMLLNFGDQTSWLIFRHNFCIFMCQQ